ncbi:TlpA family protein disulfide reductase [Microbulbifer sp. SSSA005]|uniref:TlpA family protein disulfide reductase n=1 Tax=Microbulbifer sp. SSSA005 TaxID=3243378 RepID=UPI0040392EB5
MRTWLALITLLFAPAGATEAAISLYDFELRSLAGPERINLQQFKGKPSLILLVEPDCPWCFRQVRTLNRLTSECSQQFQPIALGINGSRKALLTEYRKLRPEFPMLQASTQLQQVLGETPGTPFSFLIASNGEPLSWLRGYIPDKKLQPILERSFGFKCESSFTFQPG